MLCPEASVAPWGSNATSLLEPRNVEQEAPGVSQGSTGNLRVVTTTSAIAIESNSLAYSGQNTPLRQVAASWYKVQAHC